MPGAVLQFGTTSELVIYMYFTVVVYVYTFKNADM